MKNTLLLILTCLLAVSSKGQCTIGTITGLTKVTIGTTITLFDTTGGGNWTSSDTSVAIINSSTGVLKGKSRGTAIITYATSATCRATRSIGVITSFKGRTKICLLDTATMQDTLATGVWGSSRPSKISINSLTGFMTGMDTGYSVISYAYTLSGVPCIASDTVKVAAVTSVGHLTSSDTIICGNTNIELNDTTTPVIWLSRDTMVVKILNPYTDSTLVHGVWQGVTKIIFASQYCNLVSDSVRIHMDTLAYPGTLTISGGMVMCGGVSTTLISTGARGITTSWSTDESWASSIVGFVLDNNIGILTTVNNDFAAAPIISRNSFSTLGCKSSVSLNIFIGARPYLYSITGPSNIMLGTTQAFFEGYSTNGFPTTDYWYSSQPSIVSVTSSAIASGLSVGTAMLVHSASNTCGTNSSTKSVNVTAPAIGAISSAFSAFINRACAAPQFGVSVPAHAVTFKLMTSYGDNFSDTTVIPSSGVSALTTFTHVYNTSGMYSIRQVLYNGAVAIDSVTYSYQHFLCHDIAVSFYIDNNDNCSFDTTSEHLNYLPLRVAIDSNGVPKDTISATSGIYYSTWGSTGAVYSFRVFGIDSPLHFSCPASGIVFDTLLSSGVGTKNKRIALSCSSLSDFDLSQETFIVAGRHKAYGSIAIANNRCMPQNAIVTLDISPKYVLNPIAYWTSPTPTSVVGNRVTWNFTGVDATNIPPFIVYNLEVATPTWLTPGDTVHNTISVFPNTGDADPTNNIKIRVDTVKSSFDPNHVQVSPEGNVLNGTKLHYTIEFENDGNDTAQNIYVMDTLSDMLNLSSLRVIGASAVMNIAILHSGGHNIIKFDFPGIKLLDSTHHGHCTGQVMYTINAKTGLTDGTNILAHAGIFFDDNPVILTDTAYNKILIPDVSVASSNGDTICNGHTAHFIASPHSVNLPHYRWYVNSISAGSDSAGFTLLSAMGGDTITCMMTTVMDDSVYAISNKVVLINRGLPNPGVISGPVAVCVGANITLTESIGTGIWSIINSLASNTGNIVAGVMAGADTVIYTVTNVCGTSTAAHPIIINPLPGAGVITGATTVCESSSVLMTDTSIGGIWSMSNSHAGNIGNIVTGINSGYDTVLYIVSNTCGTDTAKYPITINPLPVSGTISGPSVVCSGSTITLIDVAVGGLWSLSNSHASHSGGAITGITAGIDTVLYTVTNTCGVMSSTYPVTVIPLPYAGTVIGLSSVCIGSVITLSDTASGGSWSITNAHATHLGPAITGITAGIDTVIYTVTNYCGSATARRTIVINPNVTPTVNIVNMPGDTVCAGDTVLFTATPANGGTIPVYIWKNFTTPIGTGSLFSYVPNNGDIITCSLISNAPCPVPDTVESTAHIIMVIPIVTPSNVISTPIGDSVSFIGQSVTFNSSITFCGSSPTYQWYRNGVLIPGATSIAYTTTVSDDDTFYNVANCNMPCATTSIDTSNAIVIHADYLLNTEIGSITNQLNEISLYPNPTSKTIHIVGIISWTKFRLLSIAGVTIKEGILQKGLNDIEMDGCASGVYMIQLTTENGVNRVIRIIKE